MNIGTQQAEGDEYGYARVSTKKQSIDRQVENISRTYPNAEIIREIGTGKSIEVRNKLVKLVDKVKTGDTIIFDEISRMSRNRDEGFKLYMQLYERGVELVFLKEPHLNTAMYRDKIQSQISLNLQHHSNDNGEYQGKATDNFLQALADALNKLMRELIEDSIALALDRAQKEREYLVKRTIEGLNEAKKTKTLGRPKGRKCAAETQKEIKAKAVIRKHSPSFGGALSESECIRLSGVSKRTYYKYRAELLAELNGSDSASDDRASVR